MKGIFSLKFMALALVLTGTLVTSCKKDEELDREKFIGTYSMSDACSVNGSDTYTVSITASSTDENKIVIDDLWFFSNTVTATVDGNSLLISRQEPDGDDFEVQGNGTYSSGGIISLNYTVTETNSNDNDVCQGTLTKQ